MPKAKYYTECSAKSCEGGQMECHCGRSCCSGYTACDHCDGNMLVCPDCNYHECECGDCPDCGQRNCRCEG